MMMALQGAGTSRETETLVALAVLAALALSAFSLRHAARARSVAELLRASEERYRMLFARNPHAMWVYDRATLAFLDVNEAAVRAYGWTREEFLAMRITDIRAAEDVPRLEAAIADGLASPELRLHWHRTKDGRVLAVEVSADSITVGGRDARLVSVQDVTERRRAEEALHVSEERLSLALSGAGVGLWDCDLVTGVVHWSPEWQQILGYQAHEFGNRFEWWMGIIHPDDVEAMRVPLVAHFKGETPAFESVYRLRAVDHRWVWVLARARVVRRSDSGRALRLVGTAIDITERRELEEQLRHAQKMEAVGQLAGGIAHDFNNILTAIRSYSEFVRAAVRNDAELRGDVDEIIDGAERAAALTRQLLAFSRRQILAPSILDLNQVVENLSRMLRRLIGEHVNLVTELSPGVGHLRADPGQIEQMLVNLAVNARDAMPNGGTLWIRTNVSTEHETTRGGDRSWVVLTVTDTGNGMDEATRKRIFEPFFTTKGPGKGTGLGLATVYGIVQQSGGRIEVCSEPGRGATFTVYFPTVDAPVAPPVPAPEHASPRGTETVLLVEDEGAVRTIAHRVLERRGYRVLVAASGAEALAIDARHAGAIDLVVTDVIMPEMSGPALVEKLTARRPGLPVLFMSGYADRFLTEVGELPAGALLLQKPFTPSDLARDVRAVLDRAAQRVAIP
jgi:two-component system, cell cycle sensor histidine kinase and response regulator CckA